MELLGAQAASTVDLIGIEASPQQKDTGMTSLIDINGTYRSQQQQRGTGIQVWPLKRTSLDWRSLSSRKIQV